MNSKTTTIYGGAAATVALLLVVFMQVFTGPEQTPHKEETVKQVAVKPAVTKPKAKTVLAKKKPTTSDTVSALPAQALFPEKTNITIAVSRNPVFAKLDKFQNPLGDETENWNCVLDHATGLVWEVKTADYGLQDRKNYYSWYDPTQASIGGDPGKKDNGNCRGGIDCDTHAYIQAINSTKLCGYSDWRLPTKAELMSLVQFSADPNKRGMIDKKYFPNGAVDWYWTSETDADNAGYAWYVLFYNGRSMKAQKSQAKRIRLVRGGETKRSFKNVAEHPDGKTTNKNLARETDSMLQAIKPATTPAS